MGTFQQSPGSMVYRASSMKAWRHVGPCVIFLGLLCGCSCNDLWFGSRGWGARWRYEPASSDDAACLEKLLISDFGTDAVKYDPEDPLSSRVYYVVPSVRPFRKYSAPSLTFALDSDGSALEIGSSWTTPEAADELYWPEIGAVSSAFAKKFRETCLGPRQYSPGVDCKPDKPGDPCPKFPALSE